MDFNQKSQIMRCQDLEMIDTQKFLIDEMYSINDKIFASVLENDLYNMLTQENIYNIIPFF